MPRIPFTFSGLLIAAIHLPLALSAEISGVEAMSGASEVRILTGWRDSGPSGVVHNAAIEIRLADGWKTYWRSPGSGLPPKIDWGGSINLKSIELLWPTPSIFYLNGIRTIGYEREVVFPVVVQPLHASLPVTLRATIDYGVCKDFCVLVSTQVQKLLPASRKLADPTILLAARRVPKIVNAAESDGVISCSLHTVAEKEFWVSAEIDDSDRRFEDGVAVVELPHPLVWISEAETKRMDDGRLLVSASLEFSGKGPVLINRSEFRFTLLSPTTSTEYRGCLD